MKDSIEMLIYLHSKDNPITSNMIENRYNIPGSVVREFIRELRREGKPIASCSDGYFWAKSYLEIKDTIEDLEGREISLRQTRHALENCFAQKEQLSLL